MSVTKGNIWEQSWKKQAPSDHDRQDILAARQWHRLKGPIRLARIRLDST